MQEKSLKVLEFYKIRDMLAERAASSLGKERCAALVPVNDIREIARMQAETEEAATLIARTGVQPIPAFDDAQSQIARAKVGGILSPKDLLLCARLMQASRSVRRTLVGDKEDADEAETPNLVGLARTLFPMRRLEDEIFASILSEEEIADSASPGLASVRRKIRSANERIRDKLNSYLHSGTMARYLQDTLITMRQGRYVLPVRAEYRSQVPGIVHDQSASGATLFIEPMAIVEINNDLRGLMGEERAEIEKILQQFSEEIAAEASALLDNQRILAELDFIFAKGALARQMRAVQPKINDAGYIEIKRGRHPLIDPEKVVPSDLWIGKDFTTLVVTGPNTGGKTVTLKTVGLFTLMMQAGLQVPAMLGTELAVFDDVFADIGDEQSIEQSLSTFSSHMVNIVHILKSVTPRSLALFDELGAGTDPTEGAALAMSILDKLLTYKTRTLATTHYSELKAYALTHKGVENASVEFNVETLRPTYRLSIGIPGKSNAFEISRKLGLSEEIIDAAKEWLSGEQIRFEDVITTAEMQRQTAERERQLAEEAHNETVRLRDQAEQERKKLEEQREKILRKAREDARRVLHSAQAEAEGIIRDLKKAAQEQNAKDREILEARRKLQGDLDQLAEPMTKENASAEGAPLKAVTLGQTVLIPSLGCTGSVLALPDKNGEVQLQVGLMKMKQPLSALRAAAQASAPKKEKGRRAIKVAAPQVSLELDVRGQLPEEAIDNVDKYLDDCMLAGVSEVSIVHGKGTGVLRNEISQHLRHHPHVAEFRLGRYGEGETGVTIVTLK
ncbi:MAG: endonuclease MutS2 [Candidatus Spyradocola sp.]|jgi:DNA mismatch repair protein MutS2